MKRTLLTALSGLIATGAVSSFAAGVSLAGVDFDQLSGESLDRGFASIRTRNFTLLATDKYDRLDEMRRENLGKDFAPPLSQEVLMADKYDHLDEMRRENLDKDFAPPLSQEVLMVDKYDHLDEMRRENLDKEHNPLDLVRGAVETV